MTAEDRIAALERKLTMVTAGWVASLVAFGVLWIAAQEAYPQAQGVRAHRLVLVDTAGRDRLVLGFDSHERPGLWMEDDAGRVRATLGFGVERGTPQLVLSDAAARPRVYVGFGEPREAPQLTLTNPDRTQQIYVGWGLHSGKPLLLLADRSRKGVWSVP